jgi:hypothetical protein
MRFGVITVVRMTMFFSPADGDSIFIRNVDIYLRVYTASQPEEQHRKNCCFIHIFYIELRVYRSSYCTLIFNVPESKHCNL